MDGYFAICGVPESEFRPISSAVDKLDKSPWEEVRKEMIEVKNLDPKVADRIADFVKLKGEPKTLLKEILSKGVCSSNKLALQALDEMGTLFKYLEAYGCLDRVSCFFFKR